MSVVDIIIIALLAIFGIIGFKKGLIKQIGKLLAVVLASAIAVMFYKQAATYLSGVGFISSIEGKIFTWLNGKELFSVSIQAAGEEGIRNALASMKFPGFIQNFIMNLIDLTNLPDKSIAEVVSPLLYKYICYAIGFLILYVVSWIIVGIIIAIIAKVANIVPGVGFLNRVLGLCLGALKIVLVLWGLFYGLSFLSTIPAIGDKVNEFVNSTLIKGPVGKFIYENNILIGIIEKLFNK